MCVGARGWYNREWAKKNPAKLSIAELWDLTENPREFIRQVCVCVCLHMHMCVCMKTEETERIK